MTRLLSLLLLLGAAAFSAAAQETHPRLFVTPERLAAIRAAAAVPGSHHAEALGALRTRVETADWRTYDNNAADGNWNYARSWLAREAAFLYLLTEEPRHAQIAYDALAAIHADPDPDGRVPEDGYGLSRAMVGMGFALAYDWAYHGWTEAQRTYVRTKLTDALDAWTTYLHANLDSRDLGSNWVAVCRGGELVMLLATYEDQIRVGRYEQLKLALAHHLDSAYGPSGWSQEGLGYVSYAGQFLLPAIYALQSAGDPALNAPLQQIAWPRLKMMTSAFTPDRDHLLSGVDTGHGDDDQGWTSLLLNAAPPADRPAYVAFYDRYMGVDAPQPPSAKYDPGRAGTVWALLYYPEDVPPTDPDTALPHHLFDAEKGAYFFRSRWQDTDDVLVSVLGDYDHHGHAWDSREAFQFGLLAAGTVFIGGPGKTGTGRDAVPDGYSTLLVDGQAFADGRTGAPVEAAAYPDGGYVILDGGAKYRALGLDAARRHTLVRFGPTGDQALISTLDLIRSDTVHTYTWQLNPGGPGEVHGIRIEAGREQGRPTFTLHGADGGYLKGWVLHPADARLTPGDPLRIETRSGDAEIWVVMTAGPGAPPTATITGTGLETVLHVQERRVSYHADANRLRVR